MSFPPDFFWGTATAAYQIEGAAFEDGRGLSVWDMFCRKEGAVFENQHGSVACNHYQLYQEDVEHMRLMGLNAYRFSIAWSRILPSGTGLINQKGIDFYARLIDRLLEAGIEPFPTLFHWDFPYALYLKGGWLNRQSVDWFGEYTHTVVDALSDRVQYWLTLNEPQCFVGLGHAEGIHAPGDRLGIVEFLTVGHHALMAHGRSVEVIRQTTKQPCRIGFAPVGEIGIPVSHQPADIEAARSYTFDAAKHPIWNNTWWEDPVLKGTYPTHQLMQYEQLGFSFHPDDLRQIHQPVDFFGTNIYKGKYIRARDDGSPEVISFPEGYPRTAYYWEITPEALYWGPRFFYERYQLPIYITENGMANVDWLGLDGKVHDPQRIDYLTRYLRQVQWAIKDGVDIRGYFIWTLLDNFEWAEGYRQRFGLLYVDYSNQKRIWKDSAYWYKDVIAQNGDLGLSD